MKRLSLLAFGVAACGRAPATSSPLADTAAYREARQLVSSGRFGPAAVAYARIRDSFARIGDRRNAWYGQLWWTESMTRAGKPDSADRGLELSRAMAGDDPRRLGWVGVMESHALERRGWLDSAITAANRAIEAHRSTGDPELGVFAYDALGTPLSRRGRFREALAADSTSLALRQAIPMSQRVIAGGWNEVAIGYRHLARFDEAEAALKTSYRIAREQHDTLAMALALGNLANVKDDTGDRDGAIAALLEALEAVEAIQHQRFMNEGYNDLAAFYLDSRQPELAADPAARALAGGRRMANRAIEISALEALGRVELGRRRLSAARDSLNRSVALADQFGFGPERVSGRLGLVDVALAAGDPAAARRHSEAALEIADSLGDPAIQFDAREARARALEASHHPGTTGAYVAAVDLLESIRGRLVLGDLRMGVAAPRISAYEGAIRTLLADGKPMEAFAMAERARARLLLEVIADRGVRFGGSPLDSLRQRLRETYDMFAANRDPAIAVRLDQTVAALSDSLLRLESREPIPAGRPVGMESVSKALLQEGRGLLAWFWGERQVVGWWITRETTRAVVLGSADSLARSVEFLADAIAAPGSGTLWRSAARRVYAELVAPLAPDAGDVLVVPDGPLHRVPLEVILGDGSRRVSYGPSASVLATLAQAPQAEWSREMLVVGNPRLAGGGDSLGPLPFAEREARSVQEYFRAGGADLLVGRDATIRRWLGYSPVRYRYLHFAVHARASDRRPDESALVFADGALFLPAIRRLRLNAELVTLSACETGVGRWVRGEGAIGLQYAFLAAGARAALVTLWRVPDQSAADFVQAFYRELKQGVAPREALQRVRTEWTAAPDERAHPFRWGAFVLVGV